VRLLGARPSSWIASEGPRYRGFVAPYVVTASGDKDTGPVVVKEAMAMGLPALASALMGMKEMVTRETGRLVPPGDIARLAQGLAWLGALDADARAELGSCARARCEAMFTLTAQATAMTRAIEGIRA
jgi:glycosyltransferase involved in cell wall biosynthesis